MASDHSEPPSRDALRAIFAAGIARADPGLAVAGALGEARPDRIVALGKAAIAMARAALVRHPGVPCLVVTNAENAVPLPGARVLTGGHPVPDAGSFAAGEALLAAVARLGPDARCLALISGGGSALAVAPVAGVTLADKAAATALLLAAGLDIGTVNLVRRAFSRLKGGGLARAAAPAIVETLILSDVVGDDPAAVASGPTIPVPDDRAAARRALERAGLWTRLPEGCRAALAGPAAAPFRAGPVRVVGSNHLSAEAMLAAAPGATLDPEPLVGDVAHAAGRIAATAAGGPRTWLWGGETTVVIRGPGRGGRNQELALRVAIALEGMRAPWAFLSGGTDGRDGPTDAAGAIVDGGTLGRIAAAGGDVRALLAANDSNAALALSGDLMVTGGTGTNVADLQVLRVGVAAG